jgi:ubiquinone/menaquinone biosynthesis C-methylase UbiE
MIFAPAKGEYPCFLPLASVLAQRQVYRQNAKFQDKRLFFRGKSYEMRTSKAFTEVAPHYESLMANVPYGMWVAYIRLIWSALELKPANVLEVACGTGKVSRMLAEEGFNMTGVDISEEMIEEAKRLRNEAGLSIDFFVSDVCEMRLGKEFDCAFSFFDSLNNILEYDKFIAALTRVREHLKMGGCFLFDLNTAYAFEMRMFDQKETDKHAKVRYRWISHWDRDNKICRIDMEFWTNKEKFAETHWQKAYTNEEIFEAMQKAGFQRVRIYDAYSLNPPRAKSDRVHVLGIAP